jgi:hypothetical protein
MELYKFNFLPSLHFLSIFWIKWREFIEVCMQFSILYISFNKHLHPLSNPNHFSKNLTEVTQQLHFLFSPTRCRNIHIHL